MNKKGFTLIELLAVIIILGILMIIAIPSVTKYINDSRKSSYIDTARELIGGARNLVNDGKLEMYDTDATYYIDIACIKTENGGKAVSPYGDFVKDKAYVVVTFDGKGYEYFWTSIDDSGQGVKNLVKYDKLDVDLIESDLNIDDISTLRTLDGRGKVILITERNSCKKEGAITENLIPVNSETGEESNSSGSNNPTNYIFDGTNPPTTTSPTTPPSGHNVYLGLYSDNSLAVCIKRNGTEHCFKSNNYYAEKEHIQEVFSDISCNVDSSSVLCDASDFGCRVNSDGDVNCFDYGAYEGCPVNGDGSVFCY